MAVYKLPQGGRALWHRLQMWICWEQQRPSQGGGLSPIDDSVCLLWGMHLKRKRGYQRGLGFVSDYLDWWKDWGWKVREPVTGSSPRATLRWAHGFTTHLFQKQVTECVYFHASLIVSSSCSKFTVNKLFFFPSFFLFQCLWYSFSGATESDTEHTGPLR